MKSKSEFSQLLAKESTLTSPESLDDKILSYARENVPKKSLTSSLTSIGVPWATATATLSIVVVAMLYTQQTPMNSIPSASPTSIELRKPDTSQLEAMKSVASINQENQIMTDLLIAPESIATESDLRKSIIKENLEIGSRKLMVSKKALKQSFKESLVNNRDEKGISLLPIWEGLAPQKIPMNSLSKEIIKKLKILINLLDEKEIENKNAAKLYEEIREICQHCYFPEEMPKDFSTKMKAALSAM